jgi:hypothetical protein
MDARWVECLAEAFYVVRHDGNGKSRLDPLMAGTVVVKIDQAFGLGAGVVVRCESDWGVRGWLVWDGKHLVMEVFDFPLAEQF